MPVLLWISFLFILKPSEGWVPFVWDLFVNLFSFFLFVFHLFFIFLLRQGGEFIDRLLKIQLRAGIWTGKLVTAFCCTPCSLTSLEHSVHQEKFRGSSRQSSTTPPMSIPLQSPKCPSEDDIFHKLPRTMSCTGLLCPHSLSHIFLTMVIGIWSYP
jgi:hypothetical protein